MFAVTIAGRVIGLGDRLNLVLGQLWRESGASVAHKQHVNRQTF
jgi:hypothetical protein